MQSEFYTEEHLREFIQNEDARSVLLLSFCNEFVAVTSLTVEVCWVFI